MTTVRFGSALASCAIPEMAAVGPEVENVANATHLICRVSQKFSDWIAGYRDVQLAAQRVNDLVPLTWWVQSKWREQVWRSRMRREALPPRRDTTGRESA
jgi:hypothetical protein